MIVVGFSQVTVVALSTPDGRSLADPAKQYPWTGEAKLMVLDALGDMQMPLTGGSLPEPGGEGSVFDSPLFVTVEVGWRVGGLERVGRRGGVPLMRASQRSEWQGAARAAGTAAGGPLSPMVICP